MSRVSDTSPRAEERLVAAYRRMTPRQRAECVRSLNAGLVELGRAGIRARHGAVSEPEMRVRLAALWMGRDATVRFLGWDPRVRGY